MRKIHRIIIISALPFSLASCGDRAASAADADEDSQAAAVEAAANQAAAIATTAIPHPVSVEYACKPALEVRVRYNSGSADDPEALVTISGRPYKMDAVPVPSGQRYHSDLGETADKTLSWSLRGDAATLAEGSKVNPKLPEHVLARCARRG